jgi:hypothetical protein
VINSGLVRLGCERTGMYSAIVQRSAVQRSAVQCRVETCNPPTPFSCTDAGVRAGNVIHARVPAR